MKFFVEIGPCNFDTCVQLAENGWAGIVCEPHPKFYNDVCQIYGKYPYVQKVEAAISDIDGKVSFAPSLTTELKNGEDWWKQGISHITSKNHMGTRIKDVGNNYKLYDEDIWVEAMTLNTLLERYNVDQIDYLKIDAEGHEMNILKGYDWDILPTVIQLEHWHIDDGAAKELLEEHGYIVNVEKRDIYAIR